jgi:hypothetical protein
LQLPPQVKKLVPVTAGLIVILAVSVVSLFYLVRETVGYGQRCGGGACWGYRLDRYEFRGMARLTFWSDQGLSIAYTLPDMTIEKLSEDQWLGADRAIYLNLLLKPPDDSAAPGARVRILYDFQSGLLHVDSPLALWRLGDYRSGDPARNWTTQSQFDTLLSGMQ